MALNIPMPQLPGQALMSGMNAGGQLFSRIMQPILAREQLAETGQYHRGQLTHQQQQMEQQQQQFLQNLALQKQAEARMEANAAIQRQVANMNLQKAQREADPMKQVAYMQQLIQGMRNQRNKGQTKQSQNYPALNKMFSGQGAFKGGALEQGNINLGNRPQVKNPETGGTSTVYSMSIGTPQGEVLIPRVSEDGRILSEQQAIEQFHKSGKHLGVYSSPEEATRAAEMIHQQQAQAIANPSQENEQQGFGDITPDERMALEMAGYKIPKPYESPEQKRFADLQDKLKLEKYKHEQAIENKRVENELKDKQTRQKTIDSAKNDLPHLEATLTALERMKKIAANNPDLFGHSGFMGFGAEGAAERFAKTTDNPNAGAWQTYGLNPIIDAEMKMSSRGNQLALKTSLANKPNFSEKHGVAKSKIDANIEVIKQRIAETKKIAGLSNGSDITEKNTNTVQYKPEQKVKVDMGNGKIEVMTYKEAQEKGYA